MENGKFNEDDPWNNEHFRDLRKRFIDPDFPILEPCSWCYNNSGNTRLITNPNLFSSSLRQLLKEFQE